MPHPGDLYDTLHLLGFRFTETADGKLAVSPAGKLTPEQRAAVKACREELLGLVRLLEADAAARATVARPNMGT